MTSPGATPDGPNVITILGDVLVENASFESNGSSSADTITIESFGNVSATGGLLAVSRGSGPMVMWNVYGDFTLDNAETRNSGGEKASYYFKKDGTQNLVLINPTFGGGGLPVVVEGGSTLNMDTSVVGGSGAFTVLDGAGLATAHPDGLNGSLQTTGTITLSESANYSFNGSVAQTTGTLLPAAVNTLLIDNPAGVTLVSDLAASDTLRLVTGTLTLGLASVTAPAVAGGSSSAYLLTDGTGGLSIPDVGATEVQFPVGTSSLLRTRLDYQRRNSRCLFGIGGCRCRDERPSRRAELGDRRGDDRGKRCHGSIWMDGFGRERGVCGRQGR